MLAFIFALALVGPSLADRLPYIIGGDNVGSATDYPWQGSLRYFASHSCGCALISSTWAVTAAHCVGSSISTYSLKFGSVNRFSGGQTVSLTQLIIHEDWESGAGSFPNDIAVMAFSGLNMDDTIKEIKITSVDHAGNNDCYVTGWGYTTTGGGGRLPSILQEAKINVYTNSECKETWGSSINDGHVCIGDSDAGRGSCNGDSGGPLVCRLGSDYELVGVTSWGINGCYTNFPSVYTRLTYFRSWITEKTGV